MKDPQPEPPWRPRFTLATLIKAMVVLSVLTAVLGGLLREAAQGSVSIIFFLAMVIAAPLGITIALSLVEPTRNLVARIRRRGK